MADRQDSAETLDATVERVVFHNPQSGFTVLRVAVDKAALVQTVVGAFQKLTPGERLRFKGRWIADPKHGRQFAADTCLHLNPETRKGVEKFLGSGLVPGIGPVMAKRLVDRFGVDTLEVIDKQPRRLAEVPGIGKKRAKAIRGALAAKRAVQDVMVFLESAGVSPAFAQRVYKRYGDEAIRLVSENPFRLASDIAGIGFLSADRIAGHLGVPPDSPHRAEAGLLYALEELAGEGHVFAISADLVELAKDLLSIDTADLERAVDRLVLMGAVRREGDGAGARVYLPRLHRAEERSAALVARLIERKAADLPIDADRAARLAEKEIGFPLAAEQARAFFALEKAKLLLLTGGPGTGKTTLLRGIVSCLASLGLRVELAAPTGRAARRLAEATGRDARTLHRMLEFAPKTMRFERNASRPLDAEVVVVDEVSMVDLELFTALLDSLRPAARLVLVGDPNQLPSVGPGSVLKDLLAVGRGAKRGIAVISLTEIFRQARSSLIVTGAHDILAGREPRTGDKGSAADMFLIERDEPEDCLEVIKDLVANRIPARFGLDPIADVQVLTPMHKGLLGAANLNQELKHLVGGADRQALGGLDLAVGDKVMQVRNNYDLEVFNGDIGRVTAADPDLEWVEVRFPERTVRYPASEVEQLALAYACSIHKSQGSEYPAVVVPLHTQHYVMLRRNLLYTAVTRGKRLVVIVGSRRALRLAVSNAREVERASALAERVRGALTTS